MADTAFQIQYRQQFIAGFEQHESLLRQTVTTESIIRGNRAVFLVADSGGASAVTRGTNGLIPARADNLNQDTATLQEWHDLVRKTRFNIFASQGDQRRIMQMTSMGVVNRKIDNDIISTLDSYATNQAGATAVTASLALVMRAKTILGNNAVPLGNNIFGVITPAFEAYLMQTKEFASAAYLNAGRKPFENPPDFNDRPTVFTWAGITWIVHPALTGIGTASEQCYVYHRSALGHAVDTKELQALVGYFEEQDYSWARTSVYMGSTGLQTKGIVQVLHDGSAYVAT
ncbi:MAG: phage capsid protein [Bradyrhizobium sp.]